MHYGNPAKKLEIRFGVAPKLDVAENSQHENPAQILTGAVVGRSVAMPVLVKPPLFKGFFSVALSEVHVTIKIYVRPIRFVVEDSAVPPVVPAVDGTLASNERCKDVRRRTKGAN